MPQVHLKRSEKSFPVESTHLRLPKSKNDLPVWKVSLRSWQFKVENFHDQSSQSGTKRKLWMAEIYAYCLSLWMLSDDVVKSRNSRISTQNPRKIRRCKKYISLKSTIFKFTLFKSLLASSFYNIRLQSDYNRLSLDIS